MIIDEQTIPSCKQYKEIYQQMNFTKLKINFKQPTPQMLSISHLTIDWCLYPYNSYLSYQNQIKHQQITNKPITSPLFLQRYSKHQHQNQVIIKPIIIKFLKTKTGSLMKCQQKSPKAFRIVSKLKRIQMNMVGGYKIGEEIGDGGFAKVYKAYHVVTQKFVAVKIIELENLSEKEISKARREIQIHSMLKHPNIVKIYGVTEQNNRLYIFMEYLEKGELFDFINDHGPLSENFALKLFSQLLSAINYLHEKGIAHRDIKTQNVVLDSYLNVKLIDFGLAKQIEEEEHQGRQRSGTICGSPSYCAPEIVRKERDYDGKEVDIWCLGVVLYAMVEGCLPFDENNKKMLKQNIINFKFHQPRYCSDECSEFFTQIFQPAENRPTCSDLMHSSLLRKYLLSYNDKISTTPKKSMGASYFPTSRKKKNVHLHTLEANPQTIQPSSIKNKGSFRMSHKKHLLLDDLKVSKIKEDTTSKFCHRRNIFQRPNIVKISKARLRDEQPDSPKRILDYVKGYN